MNGCLKALQADLQLESWLYGSQAIFPILVPLLLLPEMLTILSEGCLFTWYILWKNTFLSVCDVSVL